MVQKFSLQAITLVPELDVQSHMGPLDFELLKLLLSSITYGLLQEEEPLKVYSIKDLPLKICH